MTCFLLGLLVGMLWQRGAQHIRCAECHKLVRVNKPFFGSLHSCG